ncbi:hypothetical protein FLJC2902T_02360 [Flavobacterium limnosediminis JC2902]|uniref:Fibronectin type-III domain-containing protein n=1 Tax=Flavobacterium limnosediminis JC2902 TaxID=1341181 RepID=V6SZC8_9FLAO|nr:T9SS type A sorting domain-containing protein [Flavobacterium limnosediminis]ESU29760.1 hypothetical protein FLJC2902T_02360 [Flavobacterium limnosediminis JC2902]
MTKKYFLTLIVFIGALYSTFGQCLTPTNLLATGITQTSATIGWTSSGTTTQWEVLLLPANAAEPTPNNHGIIANTSPYTVTGLTPCTAYKYYVRSICSPGISSAWTQPLYFTTTSAGSCSYSANIYATQTIPTSDLFAEVIGGTAPFTFQWTLNGVIIQGATSQNLAINGQGGTYQVTVTDSANLTTTATITIQGISIVANNDSMTVYPTSNTTVNTQTVLSNDLLNSYPIYNYSSVILTPLTVPSGFTINPNGTISVLPGTAPGTYTLTYRICAVQSPTTCSTATATVTVANEGFVLKAFIDTNNNSTQDPGEANFNHGQFTYQINNTGAVTLVASSNGMYYIQESNTANTYDLGFTIDSNYSSYYTVTPSSYNDISFVAGSGVMVYNFPVTQVPYSDAVVNVLPHGAPPRPGFTYQNRIVYINAGNQPIASGTVTFNKSNTVTITNISQAGTTPTATGFTYDFSNLLPNEARSFIVTMQVPTIPTVALGNLITNSASIAIPVSDATASNNTSSLTQTIVGSYDPNDKTESHGGKIVHSSFTSNDYLTYTIQFENTGTYSAENVRINDILNAKLDETSLKMINASHAYTLNRVGNTLNWHFNGLDLLPSGKGHVTFQIKPKPGYVIGDIIPNTASIYFDFNPAIITNTFTTEFVATMGVSEFGNAIFTVYPNPTNGSVNIVSKDNSSLINTVTVTDILGKTVQTKTVNTTNTNIDLSDLSSGIYFAKVKSDNSESIIKIVKQ